MQDWSPFWSPLIGCPGLQRAKRGDLDATAKIWALPADPSYMRADAASSHSKVDTPTQTLAGDHARAVTQVKWHPSARGVVLTAAASTVRAWDVETAQAGAWFDATGFDVTSATWNSDGSKVAIATSDRAIRVVDLRDRDALVQRESHVGSKAVVLEWAGASDTAFFSTGSSQQRDRELCLWDTRFLEDLSFLASADLAAGAPLA